MMFLQFAIIETSGLFVLLFFFWWFFVMFLCFVFFLLNFASKICFCLNYGKTNSTNLFVQILGRSNLDF